MCGIFGTFGYVNKRLLMNMSDTLKHRGPDDVGFFFDQEVALGNRRLSIIDVQSGHQPIHNEDSSIWITYNGEVYNFQELRQELERIGHRFYTNSDTETVVHAYEEWGENCVQKLNGMWAFAIWDKNKQQLLLSRDRLGIKPLYYCSDGTKLIFASEMKAILLEESFPRIPNDQIIYEYLVHGVLDHSEQTFFAGIKRLLPACNMVVNRKGTACRKYWSIECINKTIENSGKKDALYAKEFFNLFTESVRMQLMSEVPIGTCLSGGLDSSTVVHIINRLLFTQLDRERIAGERQKTFSACFEEKSIDEREYMAEVIRRTNAEGNFVFPSSKGFWEEIKKVVFHQDEPFMSSSVYAQWCVMKLASRKVKVVLDGQGGDELLAGYPTYYVTFLLNLLSRKKIPSFFKELLLSFDITVPFIIQAVSSHFLGRSNEIKTLLRAGFIREFDSPPDVQEGRDVPEMQFIHLTGGYLQSLLRYEDRNSMAFSVEARVPFLDHKLIEYVFSLPVSQKLKNGRTKHILRNAMKGILPEKIRKRRRKIPYSTPEIAWMKELRDEIRSVFASEEFGKRKYFEQKEVLAKFDELCDGNTKKNASVLWRILNLEIWLRVFFGRGEKLGSTKVSITTSDTTQRTHFSSHERSEKS